MLQNKKSNNKQDIWYNFLICPDCAGSGQKSLGISCTTCGGISLGIFYNRHFFYWKPKITFTRIELNKIRKIINKIINISVFFIGILGLLSLFYWFYQISSYSIRIEDFAFWKNYDELILLFWWSLLFDLFLVFRISRVYLNDIRVKIFKYSSSTDRIRELNNWTDLKNANSNEKIDVSTAMSEDVIKIIDEAFMLARRMNHKYLSSIHLFSALLSNKEVMAVFSRLEANAQYIFEKTTTQLANQPISSSEVIVSEELKKILINAYLESSKSGLSKVTPKQLIPGCLHSDEFLKDIFLEIGIDENIINNVVHWFVVSEKQVVAYKDYRKLARFKPASSMDRAYTAIETPVLNNYAYDLTLAAKWSRLDFCVDRDKEIEVIWENLQGSSSGILLVGPDGVGKKTLIAGIAQKMVEEDVPKFLVDKRLLELDVARLISGVDASQAEGRLLQIIDEINRAGNIVLFIDNIEKIIGISSGNEGSMDLSGVLNTAISRKLFFVFSTVSSENYLKYVEGTAIDLSISKIDIKEPRGDEAIRIIISKISYLESVNLVYFSYNSIKQSVLLSDKYMHDSYLPEKAIKILELTAARISKMSKDFPLVGVEDVSETVSSLTNIPLSKFSENEGKELLKLEERIGERMVSQELAIKMVSASLRRARAELREGVRPIANFLFLGPTGVGKTELAKTVAEVYFGNEKYMIRLDMSEYQHPDSISKMIGSPDGSKGYLTELVRKSPFSLILLDEVEKAHPDILNIFLQVMDDGRLTDGKGHLIDFTNSIIIATSNIGADYIQDSINKGTELEQIKSVLINEYLNKYMRPELINRFDGVIVFEPLSLRSVTEIAQLMLDKIRLLLEPKGIQLQIEETGIKILAKLGYDPKFGARPLRRLLQEKIEDKIANKILSGELKRRDTVVIDENAEVQIEKGREL